MVNSIESALFDTHTLLRNTKYRKGEVYHTLRRIRLSLLDALPDDNGLKKHILNYLKALDVANIQHDINIVNIGKQTWDIDPDALPW